ncbi:hypothetical protein HDK77DRAFT_485664 [Phyllosticta capitalensis]|uniref:Uncharacterized protein n=1 Tax=Phyllosticta capitalensis TaxID=121624 RepID=A0ABR1YR46_9PEZI
MVDGHEDELTPEQTEGFKVGEKKTIDEYQQLAGQVLPMVNRDEDLSVTFCPVSLGLRLEFSAITLKEGQISCTRTRVSMPCAGSEESCDVGSKPGIDQ